MPKVILVFIVSYLLAAASLARAVALAPCGGDDTAAIQNAINGGGTVNFVPGVFKISRTLLLRNVVLVGANTDPANVQTYFKWSAPFVSHPPYFAAIGGAAGGNPVAANVTISGIGFGPLCAPGIYINGDNVKIENCLCDGLGTNLSTASQGISCTASCNNVTINNCLIQNTRGDTGIEGWFGNNLVITNNSLVNCWEGIHPFGNKVTGWNISNNSVVQASRHAIEIQARTQGMICNSNFVANFNDGMAFGYGWVGSHFGISAACGGSTGNKLTNNVLIGDGNAINAATGNPTDTALEAIGANITISNNYCVNWGGGFVLAGSDPGCNVFNNIWQAGSEVGADPPFDQYVAPVFANNNSFTMAQNPPAAPAVKAGVNGQTIKFTTYTPIPATATSNGNGSVTFTASKDPSGGRVAPVIMLMPTTGFAQTDAYSVYQLAKGQTSVTFTRLPNLGVAAQFTWQTNFSSTPQATVTGGLAATAAWSPTLVASPTTRPTSGPTTNPAY